MSAKPKLTVLIITYNQEKLIERAINSVLIQKEWVYEIVVCDDCSTDNNWEVILNLANQYPEIIKPFRNQHNLGIFGNLENSWTKASGNLIVNLSGDDELCNGLFEKMFYIIKKNDLDCENDSFCIYSDYKMVSPNRKEKYCSNSLIAEKHNPVILKLRNLISTRTTVFSKNVLNCFHTVPSIGIGSDGLYDIQTQLYSKRNFYISFIGSIYYISIGISSITQEKKKLESYNIYFDEVAKWIPFPKKELFWINYMQSQNNFIIRPSISKYFQTWFYFFRSIKFDYGFKIIISSFLKVNTRLAKGILSIFSNS